MSATRITPQDAPTLQPLDSDLTAIAALTTTAYGRAFLALADAAAGRTALGLGTAALSASGDFDAAGAAAAAQAASQPLDSDLTALAALTTTAYGRSLIEAADAAALRTLAELGSFAVLSSLAHSATTGITANDHHAQLHAAAHLAGGGDAVAGLSPWTTVMKTADESKNATTTVADDSQLLFNTVANTNYAVRIRAFFLTNSTADLKYRMVHTGTTTRVRRFVERTATADVAAEITIATAFDTADVILSTTGANPYLSCDVVFQVGASGGVFKLQWAQVTSNAGPTTCLEGSYLEWAVT